MKYLFKTFIILIFLGINFSCKEDFHLTKQNYTIITTKEVETITDSGIVASAEIIGDLNDITGYGFIWDKDMQYLFFSNSKILSFDTITNNKIETFIDRSLFANETYYLRTYAYTDNYYIYGNIVKFESKGVKAPVITSITPEYGSIGDDIIITGYNFINNNDTAIAKFGTTELIVEKCTETKIYAKIPITIKGLRELSVELLGKKSAQNFIILNNWTRIADFPIKIKGSVCFVLNNIAYVGTGYSDDGPINDFWKYNSETNSWIQIADFPGSPRYDAVSFSLNGFGYVGSGNSNYSGFNDFWKYNPDLNTWTRVADLIAFNVYSPISFTINDNAYVGNEYSLWKYYPITNSWTQLVNWPSYIHIHNGSAFTLNGIVYISYANEIWTYIPASNNWIQLADFPGRPRYDAVSFSLNGFGYVGSGISNYGDFWRYNFDTNSWSQIDNYPIDVSSAVAFTINDEAYVGTGRGYDYSENKYINLNTFWKFDPHPVPAK